MEKGKLPPVGRILSSESGHLEVGKPWTIWQMVWLKSQGLGRNTIGKLVTGRSEKEVCGYLRIETECEDICVSCDALQRMTSSAENLKNYVDCMTAFSGYQLASFPSPLYY